MMKIVTAAQMQTLDRRTISEARIPGLALMERAGAGVAAEVVAAASAPSAEPREIPPAAPSSEAPATPPQDSSMLGIAP